MGKSSKKTHGLIISYYTQIRDVDIMANGVYIYTHTSNNLTLGYDPSYMYVDILYIYIIMYDLKGFICPIRVFDFNIWTISPNMSYKKNLHV